MYDLNPGRVTPLTGPWQGPLQAQDSLAALVPWQLEASLGPCFPQWFAAEQQTIHTKSVITRDSAGKICF